MNAEHRLVAVGGQLESQDAGADRRSPRAPAEDRSPYIVASISSALALVVDVQPRHANRPPGHQVQLGVAPPADQLAGLSEGVSRRARPGARACARTARPSCRPAGFSTTPSGIVMCPPSPSRPGAVPGRRAGRPRGAGRARSRRPPRRADSGRSSYQRRCASGRTRTSPASRSTRRCLEVPGWLSPSRSTRSPTDLGSSLSRSRMRRRVGSARAAKAFAMRAKYRISYIAASACTFAYGQEGAALLPATLAVVGLAACGEDSEKPRPMVAASEPTSAQPRPVRRGPLVKLRDSQYGRVLFSGKDQAVYLFTKDARRRSRCHGECAKALAALLREGPPAGRRRREAIATGHDQAPRRPPPGHLPRPPALLLRGATPPDPLPERRRIRRNLAGSKRHRTSDPLGP